MLPTGLQTRRPVRIGGSVPALVDGGRRALEDVELLGVLGQLGYSLDGGGAGAEVRQGVEVTNLLRDGDTVDGVAYSDADGTAGELRAPIFSLQGISEKDIPASEGSQNFFGLFLLENQFFL